MTTLTGSVLPQVCNFSQLIENGTRLAISMGAHQVHLSTLSDEIGNESLDLNRTILLAETLKKFQVNRQLFQEFQTQVEESGLLEDYDPSQPKLDEKPILKKQIELITIPFAEATISGNLTISRLLTRIEGLFDVTLDKLNDYRQTRRGWCYFTKASGELKNWVSIIFTDEGNFITRASWPLNTEHTAQSRQLSERAYQLEYLTSSSPIPNFLRLLDIQIENHRLFADTNDSHLSTWPEEWQSQLDEILSTRLQKPAEWIKEHRYDDLTAFREAYLEMVRRYFLKTNKYLSDPTYRAAFFQRLYQYAYGPEGVNPIEWSEKELPYLVSLINVVNNNFEVNLKS